MSLLSLFKSAPSPVYAKTALGQKEIQDRSVGLALLERRLLLLMNGQRRVVELNELMPGQDLQPLIQTLLDKRCIEQIAASEQTSASKSTQVSAIETKATTAANNAMSALPPAEQRTPAQNEMARNFMINSVNTVFGQYTRLTLIETIAHAKGTDGLRQAYFMWASALEDNRIGSKRLPDLQNQLFKVL